MKQSKGSVKSAIAKVHKDLSLIHNDAYPIFCRFHDKTEQGNHLGIAYWGGGFDYSNPLGEDGWGDYPEYIITIDDDTGEAVMYSYWDGHYYIKLVDGIYTVLGRLGLAKRPW